LAVRELFISYHQSQIQYSLP